MTNPATVRCEFHVFVREKHINGYTYLYLVESVREAGEPNSASIKNLGRKEVIVASGDLETASCAGWMVQVHAARCHVARSGRL